MQMKYKVSTYRSSSNKSHRLNFGVKVAAAVLLLTTSIQAADVVVKHSANVKLRGSITQTNTSEITLELRNGKKEVISVADLKTVQFDKEPSSLAPARANENSGGYETALSQLNDAKASYTGTDRRIRTEIEFLVARVTSKHASQDTSLRPAAIEAMEAFRIGHKTNFRYLEATLHLALLHSQQNDTDKAKELLKEVRASSVRAFQLQAGVDLAQLLLDGGDSDGAFTTFQSVVNDSKDDATMATIKYAALLGQTACQQKQDNIKDALATLDAIIQDVPSTETGTLAKAWIQKGNCYRQKEQLKAALMAYLHVDVLYSGEASQHAEALLRLSQLWGPSGHQDRAVEAKNRLTKQYPMSPWAQQAASGG